MRRIYLDYNATTPIAPRVQEAMLPFIAEHFGNPSSSHALGRAAAQAVDDARAQIAELLGSESDEIVFTSCGTESNNLALKGTLFRRGVGRGGHLVISAIEHPAIAEPAAFLQRFGFDLTIVGCDSHGVVDPDEVKSALRPDTLLVSVMHANNEIGTVQPISAIAQICRERKITLHTDAAQSVGKLPVRVDDLDVDLLTIAGHKVYAPKGIGALYVRPGTALEPLLHGAGHEGGLRAGTENVPYIVALGEAAAIVNRNLSEIIARSALLRDRLERRLRDTLGEKLSFNATSAERLPNTISVNFHSANGAELLARVPELCVSTGAACHSGSASMSATLEAIGLKPEVARGTVRLSLGWYTTEEEVDRAADLLSGAWEGLQG